MVGSRWQGWRGGERGGDGHRHGHCYGRHNNNVGRFRSSLHLGQPDATLALVDQGLEVQQCATADNEWCLL
jgi:hypothetical protein